MVSEAARDLREAISVLHGAPYLFTFLVSEVTCISVCGGLWAARQLFDGTVILLNSHEGKGVKLYSTFAQLHARLAVWLHFPYTYSVVLPQGLEMSVQCRMA
jgi:hypothetical protein